MTRNDTLHSLTARQRRFVAAMLTAASSTVAAELAGIARVTAHRYLRNPAVKLALSDAFDETMAQTMRQVVAAMTDALQTLRDVHADEEAPVGVRVTAACAILEAGPRLREAIDIAERVTELERRLHEG